MENLLKVENVHKIYGNEENIFKALNDISFTVDKGSFVSIMGPSGSGKSTLLNVISTIDKVSAGEIYINNQKVSILNDKQLNEFRANQLGFIFQDYNLLTNLSASDNIALALAIRGLRPKSVDIEVRTLARKMQIEELLEKFPNQLSGGQQQRIAAARALITKPSLILADEPTGSLDSKSARELLKMLCDINQQFDATILMVTHDAMTASFSDRVLFIKDGTIFNELNKGQQSRHDFFNKIMDMMVLLGGDMSDTI